MYFRDMEVRVLLFASYADAFGAPHVAVTVPDGSTVAQVLAAVRQGAPGAALPPAPMMAVNLAYAAPDDVVRAGDEVALIPPVAGG